MHERGNKTNLFFAINSDFCVVFVLDGFHVLYQVRQSARIVPVRSQQPLFNYPEKYRCDEYYSINVKISAT